MLRKVLTLFLLLLTLGLPSRATAGGWATVTLIALPQNVEAGVPLTLEFVVRQHGRHLMDGLSPTVRAQLNGHTIDVPAEPGRLPGHYLATVTFPTPGAWAWQIEAFTMTTEMPPLTVTLPEQYRESPLGRMLAAVTLDAPAAAATVPAEYGKQLFVAKGCITCHAHPAVPGYHSTNMGADLSIYDRSPVFTRTWLRNAAEFTSDRPWPMPTLELSDAEIDALIAFLAEGA